MADRIRSGCPVIALPMHDPRKDEALFKYSKYLAECVEDAVVIEGSNVAEYFFCNEEPKGNNLFDTIPNMAPPYEKFFVEFDSHSSLSGRTGCVFWTKRFENASEARMFAHTRQEWANILEWRDATPLNAPIWHLECVSVLLTRHGFSPLTAHNYFVDVNGKPASKDSPAFIPGALPEFQNLECQMSLDRASIQPALMAISFMHCKNIKVQPQEPSSKLSKAFQKRHGKPLLRYHTLEIEPMKKVLETEGSIGQNGLKKALHICRGHFAHYTPEKPLFGRVTGTVWKPAHVRGSAAEGIVAKDYKIKSP